MFPLSPRRKPGEKSFPSFHLLFSCSKLMPRTVADNFPALLEKANMKVSYIGSERMWASDDLGEH